MTRTIEIAKDVEGTSVLSYLCARFTYQSQTQWIEHIAAGRVALNGLTPLTTTALLSGDRISFSPEPYEEPPVAENFGILLEDDDFLFIDKPANLPCHPAGIYLQHTLQHLLKADYGAVNFVNRLDRETSGIVVAAKTSEGARYASDLMASRKVRKEYLVIVDGVCPEYLSAQGILSKDENSPIRKKLKFIPTDAKAESAFCHTDFTRVALLAEGRSLIRARLHTGRTHQIRATLSSLGLPVTGDKLYGKDETIFLRFIENALTERDLTTLAIDRQALHCERVSFTARDGHVYDVTSPLPGDLAEIASRIPQD
jgi:23S rRNA pseudouridine1911/1915/1917 synthase